MNVLGLSLRGQEQKMKAEGVKDPHRIFVEEGHLIHEALKKGAREAILRHKREGLPVVIYRDGKTVWVQADELGITQD